MEQLKYGPQTEENLHTPRKWKTLEGRDHLTTLWGHQKISPLAGEIRVLPNDPKTNNSMSRSSSALFFHSGDCVWWDGRVADDGIETGKPKFNMPSLHCTPAEISTTHPSSSPHPVSRKRHRHSESPKARTACHSGDKKPGPWLHFYPQGAGGQDPLPTVTVLSCRHVCSETGHLNQMTWEEQ